MVVFYSVCLIICWVMLVFGGECWTVLVFDRLMMFGGVCCCLGFDVALMVFVMRCAFVMFRGQY